MKTHLTSVIQMHKRQQGVVLFFALIVMIAMTLAGLALIRSTDTANIIAGNIAFRESALQEADVGIEAGFNVLANNLSVGYILNRTVDAAPLYYATMQTAATVPALPNHGAPTYIGSMSPSDVVSTSDVYALYANGIGPNGNRVRYVIERMCKIDPLALIPPSTAAQITDDCLIGTVTAASDNGSHNALKIKLNAITVPAVYYRITVRVDGPRNTVSIAQAIVRT